MNLSISKNIKTYRKALGITQSQLAEALGVTIGAVSKWEAGSSNPDIELIVQLADFFETSVDTLLGYEWRSLGMGKTVEKIREYGHNKNYDLGKKEVEKALQKYPNCFDIIYYAAEFLYMKGVEQLAKQDLQRALELYQHSLDFIQQNEDEEINEVTIQITIGDIFMALGEIDTAIAHLNKYNYCGINSDKIGFYLSQQDKPEEALPYLSDSYLVTFSTLFRIGLGFVNCYSTKKEYDIAIDCLLGMNSIVQGLKKTSKTSYMDKLTALLFTIVAQLYALKENTELSHEYLRKAREIALSFDANPEFSCSNIKFYCGKEQPIYDDFGETAMLGIENVMKRSKEPYEELLEYWKTLNGGEE